MKDALTLDGFMSRYAVASDDLKQAALEAAARVLDGATPNDTDSGRCLTITAAAKRINVGRPTLYRAIRSGALRTIRLYDGGNFKILEADFRAWLEARRSAG